MKLVLYVVHPKLAGQTLSKDFGPEGGIIGRDADSAWVLPSAGIELSKSGYVSRRHAEIIGGPNGFQIQDCESTNGTYIGSDSNEPLAPWTPHPIDDNDHIFIGDFELLAVLIDSGKDSALEVKQEQGHSANDHDQPPPADSSEPIASDLAPISSSPGSDEPPPSLANPKGELSASQDERSAASDSQLENRSVEEELEDSSSRYELPPEDWFEREYVGHLPDRSAGAMPSGTHTPIEAIPAAAPPTVAPARSESELNDSEQVKLEAFFQGVGVSRPEELTPEAMHQLGKALRIAVEGLQELMDIRAQFKEELLREDRTGLDRVDNNPIKQTLDVERIIALVSEEPAGETAHQFKPLDEACQETIDDATAHQTAIVAVIQALFDAMIVYLDPHRIEEKSRRLGRVDKGRSWDTYRTLFEALETSDNSFNTLFGGEMAAAYHRSARTRKSRQR